MNKRFEFVEKEGFSEGAKIIVDKETGVQYLLAYWTSIGSDCAPHWAPTEFCQWEDYDKVWQGIMGWLTK